MSIFRGVVEHGTERAKALGYSTINIPLGDTAVSGIYAAKVKVGEEEYEAVAYADQRRGVLEAHIFDFSEDLYGWNVTIELLAKIREYKKFTDDVHLQAAITGDVAAARFYFKKK